LGCGQQNNTQLLFRLFAFTPRHTFGVAVGYRYHPAAIQPMATNGQSGMVTTITLSIGNLSDQ